MKTREAKIKALARAQGFDAAGIAPAAPFVLAGEMLAKRIADGTAAHYGFTPESIPGWTTPELALPGARSILSVALSYGFEEDETPAGGLQGSIARFARGRDYHRVLGEKLGALSEAISEEFGAPVRAQACADTGPLLDRPAALLAGIGWQGRNTCLYVRDLGSWVVLGELVLDLELEPDTPTESNRCGGCDRCRKACPTGALKQPFALEISRCVSHLTQMVGEIPEPLRAAMGTSIYGCDICQQACPHNAKARLANHPETDPALGAGARPDLAELITISQSEFDRRFRYTAIGRIGRRRLRRNAIIALGNLRDPAAVPLLQAIACGPDALLRTHAKWALRRAMGDEQ